jgi:cell division protein FtsL
MRTDRFASARRRRQLHRFTQVRVEYKKVDPMDILLCTLGLVTVMLYTFNIYSNNYLATEGIVYSAWDDELREMKAENTRLKQSILEARSYNTIRSKAYEMGLQDITSKGYFYE